MHGRGLSMAVRSHWQVAVIPGDGIGVEVTDAALRVLDAVLAQSGARLEFVTLPWPSTTWHQQHGEMMPADALEQLRGFDALLLGALGDPGPLDDPHRYVLPDGISLAPLLTLRKGFDLWACERPARLLPGARQYLADPRARDVDMLVIRENSEGEYVNQGGRLRAGQADEIATQLEVFSRPATERLIRHAFLRAQQRLAERQSASRTRRFRDARGGEQAAQVCLITKRNAQRFWGEMYCDVFDLVAAEFPNIAVHHELVDAACMKFVQQPWQFDVVVASNLHGDILTDLAAVLSGGMGVAPSANLNPAERSIPPLFEPTHGSAPDIAGRDIADPRATLFSAKMMLDWMAIEDPRCGDAARLLEQALARDLAAKHQTPRGTRQIATDIAALLAA